MPKSISQISKETGLPLSTTYRRLRTLIDGKLVNATGDINYGKKSLKYQSKIKKVLVDFDEKTDVRIFYNKKENYF